MKFLLPGLTVSEPGTTQLLNEAAEATTERIVADELARRDWKPEDLAVRRKGNAAKVAMAVRLRRETTMTLGWIAAQLRMGMKTYLDHWLYREQRNTRKNKADTID